MGGSARYTEGGSVRRPARERAAWTRLDLALVLFVTGIGAATRAVSLRTPAAFVFDEFYAADACLFVRGPGGLCRTTSEIGIVHPPLAKWLIGVGVQLFGFNSGGWRAASLVAGTLTVSLLYLIARRLLRSTLAAVVASS